MIGAESINDNLKEIDLTGEEIPYRVVEIVSKEAAERYQMIVFGKTEDSINVAMVDPENIEALNALRFIANKFNLEVEVYKTSEESFRKGFEAYDRPNVAIDKAVKDYEKEEIASEKRKKKQLKKRKFDPKALGSAPVAKIVEVILEHAIVGGASDIHIEPQEKDLRIRFRLDGDLYESFRMSKDVAPAIVSRIKIMSNLKIDEKRKPQDGRFKTEAEDKKVDVRVSTLPTAEGEKVVMRILEEKAGLEKFENLGLMGRNLAVVKKGLDEPYGVILVTGPTGSGKSTTIFTALRMINKIETNIVTLEDPVEYKIAGVNHSQVKPEIGFTFASGLRSILRQDPDVIMVGEIRDSETAELAIHAALTGHLVLSTLHTNDALGAIPRLVDMGVEPFLLSSSIRVTMAQRLIRKLCPYCKEQIKPSERVKEYVLNSLKLISEEERKKNLPEDFDYDNFMVWKGKGCSKCRNTGAKGRVAIYEVVECGAEMRQVIDDDLTAGALKKEFQRQGATLMREDGVLKALNGLTTIEFVEEATSEDSKLPGLEKEEPSQKNVKLEGENRI